MACKKYKLFNSGETTSFFNYQRCDDALWEYQIELLPNQIKNIWLLDSTFSTAYQNRVIFLENEVFPPIKPVVDINLFAGFSPGSVIAGFSANASSPVDCDVKLDFICNVGVLTGSPFNISSSVTIPKGQTNGFTETSVNQDYNNLSSTSTFSDVSITTTGTSSTTFAKGTTTTQVGVITQGAFSACCDNGVTKFRIANIPYTAVTLGNTYYVSASTSTSSFVGCATYYGSSGGTGTIYTYTNQVINSGYTSCTQCSSQYPCPTPTPTKTPTPTRTPTKTPTPTITGTKTPTPTKTPTQTTTPTNTSTQTSTPTKTPTQTSTPVSSQTSTPTVTKTPTPTLTPTKSLTPTVTKTSTPTPTPTQSGYTPLRTFYVSSSYSGATQNGSLNTPWTGLTQVGQYGSFAAGDAILFKKGDTFYCQDRGTGCTFGCGFRWWGAPYGSKPSGTAQNPITFSSYGTGNTKPNFLYPQINSDIQGKVVLHFEATNYIIIDGLQFNDPRYPTVFKVDPALTGVGIFMGEDGVLTCNNNIVRNCYFNNVGNGIVYNGDYNQIYDNVMENFGNLYAYTVASYGANGITMTGNYNKIYNNYIKGAWAWAEAFGFNGGGLELFETNTNNLIYNNTFIDCDGIAEMGASSTGKTSNNNIFSYNKILNCGGFSYTNGGGIFAINSYNNKFYNNVLVENAYSRFTGPNFGTGFTNFPTFTGCTSGSPYSNTACLPQPRTTVFNFVNLTGSTIWDLKNNIFCLMNQPTVFQKNGVPFSATGTYTFSMVSDGTKVIHQYNKYVVSGGSINYSLSTGETSGSSLTNVFVNTTNPDPELWNYHTISAFTGINVGLTYDFANQPVTNPPYIGIYNSLT